MNIRPRTLAQRTSKEKKRIRESEKERKRERWKETNRQRDKERKREGREKERQRREREKSGPPSDFQHRVFSLKIRSPALRTMVLDVAKLKSMLRDALDEVSGLETMLVTARARVRRNETPFSFKAFSSKKFLPEHPFPWVAVLKHRLRRVAVQELAEEIGGAAEVEDVLAELESESHVARHQQNLSLRVCSHSDAGRVPCGRGSQATASDARRVAWSCGCQAGASSQTRA